MNKAQKQKALQPLRFAIKGWAFTDPSRLAACVQHASIEADKLPPELKADADELMAPLKKAALKYEQLP